MTNTPSEIENHRIEAKEPVWRDSTFYFTTSTQEQPDKLTAQTLLDYLNKHTTYEQTDDIIDDVYRECTCSCGAGPDHSYEDLITEHIQPLINRGNIHD